MYHIKRIIDSGRLKWSPLSHWINFFTTCRWISLNLHEVHLDVFRPSCTRPQFWRGGSTHTHTWPRGMPPIHYPARQDLSLPWLQLRPQDWCRSYLFKVLWFIQGKHFEWYNILKALSSFFLSPFFLDRSCEGNIEGVCGIVGGGYGLAAVCER